MDLSDYVADPGCCRVCGTANLPAVDTGIFTDELGGTQALYLCVGCITEAATIVGTMVPAARFAQLEKDHNRLKNLMSQKQTQVNETEMLFQQFVSAGKFEVTPDLFDYLPEDRKEQVLAKLSKKMRDHYKVQTDG